MHCVHHTGRYYLVLPFLFIRLSEDQSRANHAISSQDKEGGLESSVTCDFFMSAIIQGQLIFIHVCKYTYFEKQALPPTGKVTNTIYPSLQKKKIPSF